MKIKSILLSAFLLTATAFTCIASAQEGHPFNGTWRGTINADSGASDARSLVIIMDYDGENITGMINPGRSSYRFANAELDASNWLLSAQATTRDDVAVSFKGILNDVGASNRYLEGEWSEGDNSYSFKVTRE